MAHRIEVSPSGRATCRSCKKTIPKGELRFGEEAVNAFSDSGEMTYRWHHLKCAASKLPHDVKPLLASYEGEIPDRAEIDAAIEDAAKSIKAYPHADKAPTGRARCVACGESVEKGALRVVIEREVDTGRMVTKGAASLHPKCAPAYVDENGGTDRATLESAIRSNSRIEPADVDSVIGAFG